MIGKSLGNLFVRIGADTTDLKKGEADASSAMSRMSAGFATAAKAAAAMGVAVASAMAAVAIAATKSSLETIDAQSKIAARLGATVTGLQALTHAGGLAGLEMSEVERSLELMNSRLGEVARTAEGPAYEALKRLGLSAQDLSNMDADERVAALADRITELGYTTQQQADVLREFGIRNQSLMNLMEGGGGSIRAAREEIQAFGIAISDIDAIRIEQANDAVMRMHASLVGVGNQIAIRLAPLMEGVATMFSDAAKETGGFGDAIDKAISLGVRLFAAIAREIYLARVGFDEFVGDILNGFDTLAGAMPSGLASIFGGTAEDYGFKPVNESWGKLRASLEAPMSSTEIETWLNSVKEKSEAAAQEVLDARRAMTGDFADTGPTDTQKAASEKMQEQMDARLEALRMSLMTEEEAERNSYAMRLIQIQEFYDAGMVAKGEYDEMMERSQQEHSERMIEIAQRQADQEMALRSATLNAVASTLGSIGSAINSFGEKNLAAVKAFSVAQALINTYEGITKALTLPFPLNWAQAAAVGAAGFAQVASIINTSKGSSGGSASSGVSAGAASASTPSQTLNLSLQGISPSALYSGDQVRELAQTLVQYQRDGGQLVLVET